MRFNSWIKAFPIFGIISVLAACSTGQPNHPSPPATQGPSPTLQEVATDRVLPNQRIRAVDFANFTFPWVRELGETKKTFTLRNGEFEPTRDKRGMIGEMGVRLQSVSYGDATADGGDEAIVVLSMVTGGSAIPNATYIYALEDEKPKLLWTIFTGDRAEGGLRRVYVEKDELVVERYSPLNSKGDCCPTLFTRNRYKWQDKHFEQAGKEEALPNSEGRSSPLMDPYRLSR